MTTDDRRRAIGKVVSVAADRLVVELHGGTANFTVVGFDDVHYVARLGSFVVMPAQAEYVVAEVVGLREKDAPSSRSVDRGVNRTRQGRLRQVPGPSSSRHAPPAARWCVQVRRFDVPVPICRCALRARRGARQDLRSAKRYRDRSAADGKRRGDPVQRAVDRHVGCLPRLRRQSQSR